MNERISITGKKPEINSRNSVPQVRRKTESSQSMNSPVDRILFLQRTIGNQAVGKLMKSGALQARLRIGQPGDIYEQEADRVAEQVMRMPDVSEAKDTRIQRKCPKCLNGLRGLLGKDEKLQAKEIRGETPEVTSNMETNINALRGGGQPLPESVSAFFEPRFGHDFSQVRVHSGGAAEQSAREVNANAYTVGHNVVFGTGQFAPETHEGRRLIAHELTHVIQQRDGAEPTLRRSLAGCYELVEKEKGLGLLSGSLVHRIIAADFQSKVKGARRSFPIPGASAGPLRTDDLCGKPSSVIDPEEIGGTAPTAGTGFPDLARVTPGRILQVAEIKPAALVCLVDGEKQFLRYKDQGNAPDQSQANWRASKGINRVSPLSSSEYPPRTFSRATPAGMALIETDWCTPGLLAYSVSLKRKRSRRRVRVPVRVPVRVDGYHPFFEDYANRLPYREAPEARDFILVLEAGLFTQHVAEAHRQLTHSMTRGMRIDPRGIPLFQVQPVLIGGAMVAGVIAAAILVVLLAPAIGALMAAAVEAGAAAASAVAAAAARTAASWTVVQLSKAAATAVVARLVAGGMPEAEAAEAVKPLVGKSLIAMADVTAMAEWANAKPGQEMSIGGESFRAIIRLTTH